MTKVLRIGQIPRPLSQPAHAVGTGTRTNGARCAAFKYLPVAVGENARRRLQRALAWLRPSRSFQPAPRPGPA